MTVGTLGMGIPDEVLVAAGADTVAVAGDPDGATELADRFIEPMVGGRARSQLQRLLDGTYAGLEVLLVSRETDAPLRVFYTLRELRRLEPERRIPPVHLFDFQHVASAPARSYNRRRVRELCDVVGAEPADLPEAIRTCNARRDAGRRPGPARDGGSRTRIYLAGSELGDTRLPAAIAAAGGLVVGDANDLGAVRTGEDGDAVEALVERCLHPALARARAGSAERAAWIAGQARAAQADMVLAVYLDGDDGLRWEVPELRDALAAVGMPVVMHDRRPFDVEEVALDG